MTLSLNSRIYLGVTLACAAVGTAHGAPGACRRLADPPAPAAGAASGASAAPAGTPALGALGRLGGPIVMSADQETASLGPGGVVTLTGHASVKFGQREIDADRLVYDRARGEVSASGHVRYRDPTVIVQGDRGSYGAAGGQFQHASFRFLRQPGEGSAQTVSMSPSDVITLRDVTYTSCPPGHADWQIRAASITLDRRAGRGVGRGARVDFLHLPIMYLPWLSFPLSAARKSGFLFPTIGSSSRSGFTLSAPWYWNIAPNQDATFTPTYYSSRGVNLGAQYRFLSAADSGTLEADFLPHDQKLHIARSYVSLSDRYRLPDNWRVDANAQNVSDNAYFEDFTQAGQPSSTAFLPRDLSVSHRDDVWNFTLQTLDFQTLDNTLPLGERPYIELPRVTAQALWPWSGWPALQAGFGSEFVDFTRADGVTGARLDLRPQLGLDLSAPGYFLRPRIAWELTRYQLRHAPGPSSLSRSLPIASLDTGLDFERLTGRGGVDLVTLEPRLMYVYIPYRNQSQLPVFDTAIPDLNLIELFRPNRYVGIDRIGDTNSITAALTTQLFRSATGQRYLSASIGQRVNFTRPRVTLPGEVLATSDTSNLIAEIDLTAYRHWDLLLDAASDPSVKEADLAEATVQYRLSARQIANFSYRFRRGELEQIDTSTAWRVSAHWDLYGRAVYSLRDHQSIEDFAGLQYRGGCWGLRAVAYRSLSTRTGGRDTGVMLQLQLNGLASIGSGVDAFLAQSIQGYSRSRSSPTP